MKNITKNVLLLGLAIALAFLPSAKVDAASTNNFYFKDFSAEYTLSKNDDNRAVMRVREEIVAVFQIMIKIEALSALSQLHLMVAEFLMVK